VADRTPTIKGIFVNSHVEAVRQRLGDEGVAELERRFGGSVQFRSMDDVPVRDEVRLIETSLDLLSEGQHEPSQRAFEAGRLHFRNFSTTPWAKVLFTVFPRNFKYMIMHASTVAQRVFKGVRFESTELSDRAVRVVMSNNDYPLDHFRGLFQEWMEYFGLTGTTVAEALEDGQYAYTASWEEP
jgi:uncharacterized protein (TIGR02265 family)